MKILSLEGTVTKMTFCIYLSHKQFNFRNAKESKLQKPFLPSSVENSHRKKTVDFVPHFSAVALRIDLYTASMERENDYSNNSTCLVHIWACRAGLISQ